MLMHFQVYHLSSVRMRELCDRLEVDAELCSEIWTCFEHCMMQHTELMKDRHLDQIIMCSVYVMAKVSNVCSHSCSNIVALTVLCMLSVISNDTMFFC